MRFLLLCPVALLLLATPAITLPTESPAEKEITTASPRAVNPKFARKWYDLNALNEQNVILAAKLKAVESEVSKLRESQGNEVCKDNFHK